MTLAHLWLPSLSVPASGPPVAGYVAWFDASQITGLADGASLTTWTDLSGNGNTVTAVSTAPTYYKTTAGELINGLPTVQFNGTPMSRAATSSVSLSAATLFFVVGHGDNLADTEGVLCNRPSSPSSTTNWAYYVGGQQWNGSAFTGPGYTSTTAAFMVSLTQTSSAYNVWKNGTAAPGNPYANGIGTAGTYTFELGGSTQSGETLDTNICEVILYPSALSTANRQSVESYLRTKWGTP